MFVCVPCVQATKRKADLDSSLPMELGVSKTAKMERKATGQGQNNGKHKGDKSYYTQLAMSVADQAQQMEEDGMNVSSTSEQESGVRSQGARQDQEGAGQDQGGAGQDQGGARQDQGGAGQDQGGARQDQGGAGQDQGGARKKEKPQQVSKSSRNPYLDLAVSMAPALATLHPPAKQPDNQQQSVLSSCADSASSITSVSGTPSKERQSKSADVDTTQKAGVAGQKKTKKQKSTYATLATDIQPDFAQLNKQLQELQTREGQQLQTREGLQQANRGESVGESMEEDSSQRNDHADGVRSSGHVSSTSGASLEGPPPSQNPQLAARQDSSPRSVEDMMAVRLQHTVLKMHRQHQEQLGHLEPVPPFPQQRDIRRPPRQAEQATNQPVQHGAANGAQGGSRKSKKSHKGGKAKGCYVELAEMMAPALAEVNVSFESRQQQLQQRDALATPECTSSSQEGDSDNTDQQEQMAADPVSPGQHSTEEPRGNQTQPDGKGSSGRKTKNKKSNRKSHKNGNAYVALAEVMQPELAKLNGSFNSQGQRVGSDSGSHDEAYVFVSHEGETHSMYSSGSEDHNGAGGPMEGVCSSSQAEEETPCYAGLASCPQSSGGVAQSSACEVSGSKEASMEYVAVDEAVEEVGENCCV